MMAPTACGRHYTPTSPLLRLSQRRVATTEVSLPLPASGGSGGVAAVGSVSQAQLAESSTATSPGRQPVSGES